jgi:hypothetical protein
MIAKYSRTSLAVGLPGVLLQIVCGYLFNQTFIFPTNPNTVPQVGAALALQLGMFAGSVLFIIGLSFYAKAKGYSALLGLLGLLSCLGLLIIAVLPDKTKSPR